MHDCKLTIPISDSKWSEVDMLLASVLILIVGCVLYGIYMQFKYGRKH